MLCFFCFRHTRRKARLRPNPPNPKKRRWVGREMLHWRYRLLAGFYLEFIVWGRSTPEWPRSGVRGHTHPERFWNEYALRCNLVHFETQFWRWNVAVCAPTSSRLMIFPVQLLMYCNDNNIFFFGGGGGTGHFFGGGWGSLYTLNILV